MKQKLIILLLSLLIPIVSNSQNIYPRILTDSTVEITTKQLKQSNLIFLERDKFKKELNIKDSIIIGYEKLTNNYLIIDSLRKNELNIYDSKLKDLNIQITKVTNKNKMLKIVTIVACVFGVTGISSIFIK